MLAPATVKIVNNKKACASPARTTMVESKGCMMAGSANSAFISGSLVRGKSPELLAYFLTLNNLSLFLYHTKSTPGLTRDLLMSSLAYLQMAFWRRLPETKLPEVSARRFEIGGLLHLEILKTLVWLKIGLLNEFRSNS